MTINHREVKLVSRPLPFCCRTEKRQDLLEDRPLLPLIEDEISTVLKIMTTAKA